MLANENMECIDNDDLTKAIKGTRRFTLIRNSIFLSGISVFAQLYLFQPMLALLCKDFAIAPATSSMSVSASTIGMAAGLFIFAFTADSISRTRLMGISLFLSSILTIISTFVNIFPLLIAVNFVKGIVLSGVSAVALTYLSEEVSFTVIGVAISLYLSGNTFGGMSGRVLTTLISGWQGWRIAALSIGIISLILSLVFIQTIPASYHFTPKHIDIVGKLKQMKRQFLNPKLMGMFLIAFLSMGVFVSVYNYLSFILQRPPFSLPHHFIAMIFLMYTTGIGGSVFAGKWSDKMRPVVLLKFMLAIMLIGLLLLQSAYLWIIVLGLGLMTFAFFGAHTMASRIVSQEAKEAKSSAICIYWLFYYCGSSLIGSTSGIVLFHYGWPAFTLLSIILIANAIVITILTKRPSWVKVVILKVYVFIHK